MSRNVISWVVVLGGVVGASACVTEPPVEPASQSETARVSPPSAATACAHDLQVSPDPDANGRFTARVTVSCETARPYVYVDLAWATSSGRPLAFDFTEAFDGETELSLERQLDAASLGRPGDIIVVDSFMFEDPGDGDVASSFLGAELKIPQVTASAGT